MKISCGTFHARAIRFERHDVNDRPYVKKKKDYPIQSNENSLLVYSLCCLNHRRLIFLNRILGLMLSVLTLNTPPSKAEADELVILAVFLFFVFVLKLQ